MKQAPTTHTATINDLIDALSYLLNAVTSKPYVKQIILNENPGAIGDAENAIRKAAAELATTP